MKSQFRKQGCEEISKATGQAGVFGLPRLLPDLKCAQSQSRDHKVVGNMLVMHRNLSYVPRIQAFKKSQVKAWRDGSMLPLQRTWVPFPTSTSGGSQLPATPAPQAPDSSGLLKPPELTCANPHTSTSLKTLKVNFANKEDRHRHLYPQHWGENRSVGLVGQPI